VLKSKPTDNSMLCTSCFAAVINKVLLISRHLIVQQNKLHLTVAGEVKDRHVVILDDLVQSGRTLIECAKAGSMLSV